MGVIIATGPFAMLGKVDVPADLIALLKQHAMKLVVDFNEVSVLSATNVELAKSGPLAVSTSNILKSAVMPYTVKLDTRVKLTAMIVKAFESQGVKLPPLPSEALVDATEAMNEFEEIAGKPMNMKVAPQGSGICALRDAQVMYQQVRGSSDGSVYVTVALSDKIRIAARIKGNKLSVRAESPDSITPFMAKLAAHGFKDNTTYASSHFNCEGTGVTVDKTLGAVLVGCGIEFNTPLPNMQKVRELSK